MIMKIKQRREEAGLSVTDFALRLGVSHSVVCNWESEVALPRVRLLPDIARVLGCGIEELFDWDETKERRER